MIAGSQSHLNALRDFLLSAFSASELDELLFYAENPELRAARDEYVDADGKPEKVRKVLDYCERHELLGELEAEIGRARPGQFRVASAAAMVPARLPADLDDFTGRDVDIEKVLEHLNSQGAVTISGIHGMGGIGKTALAVHVAHRLIADGRFEDARLYIDLKGTDPAPVEPVDALASLLNAVVGTDPGRPQDADALAALWRDAIQGQDAVLILDNAAGAAQVKPLLPGCPTCAVLVTSRQRFNLPRATRLDLDPMEPGEARALLQELASRLEDAQADEIAGLCGRLPLALRVAGNYLGLNEDVTPERYAEMLAEETRLARLRDPDDPDLDVAAAISLSVAQLDTELRWAWALLSLFPAPFDLPAAAALWAEPNEGRALERLQSLRNRSLASYDPETERYFQHDLVRLASAAQLGAVGELEPSPPRRPPPARTGREGRGEGERDEINAARLRLAHHYVGVARAAKELYKQGGAGVLEGLALFDREWPHIQAGQASASAWAEAEAKPEGSEDAAQLCSEYPDAGAYLLDLRLHARDRIAWLEAAARAARRLGDKGAEGYHLGNLGSAYYFLGQVEKAIEHYEDALEIAREIGDRRNEGAWLGNLGLVYAALGQVEKAIEQHTAALAIARDLGDKRAEGYQLGNLGSAYYFLGQVEKAIEHYEQALAISREIGDRRGEGNRLGNLGSAYYVLGQVEKAIEHYEQALSISREIGDRRTEGNQLGNLGITYWNLGQVEKAIEHYRQALDIAREIGDRHGEGTWLANLGVIYDDQGEAARAREHWTQALAIFEAIQDPNAERVRGLLADLG